MIKALLRLLVLCRFFKPLGRYTCYLLSKKISYRKNLNRTSSFANDDFNKKFFEAVFVDLKSLRLPFFAYHVSPNNS